MLLSIIIPTKNRYTTLFNIVDTIISFDSKEIEIVVQDNSDDNEEALQFVSERSHCKSLRYFHESQKLSVIENSDKAVLNSSGQYVCFIGDDDGVMSYIIEVVQWMHHNSIEVLKSFKPNYYWPDQKSNYLSNDTSGNLKFAKFDYSITKISTEKALEFTLNKGGTSMEMLPCLYHGIVSRNVLNAIYERCNTYFPGPSPDMANAIALTKFITEYTYVDFPVIISGKSVKSTGGQGVLHKHISRIEDVAHLPEDTAKYWSKGIPKYWTGPTIWAESVLKALQNCGDSKNSMKFSYSYLYASIFLFNFNQRNQIFKNFDSEIYSFLFFRNLISQFIHRSKVFIRNRLGKNFINNKRDIKTIGDCINILNKEVNFDFLPFKLK